MKKLFLISTIFLFTSLIQAPAQVMDLAGGNESRLNISGLINEAGNRSEKAEVILYKNNSAVDSITHPEKGKFKLKLPYQKENIYTLEVRSKGFIAKRISFHTGVPYYFDDETVFDFELNLIPEPQKPVYHIDYEFPVAIVRFETKTFEFDYIDSYTTGMLYDEKKLKKVVYNK